jgi:hypothetical protein
VSRPPGSRDYSDLRPRPPSRKIRIPDAVLAAMRIGPRKKDPKEHDEAESLLDTYLHAIGTVAPLT